MLTIEVKDVTSRRGGGAVTAVALVLAASLGEAVLALRSWADCDVGINAAANSLAMMYFGLPLLLIYNAVVAVVALWVTGRALRSSPRRRFWMRVTPALALAVAAYLVWAVVITDMSYPDPICQDNVPPWVPSWVPS